MNTLRWICLSFVLISVGSFAQEEIGTLKEFKSQKYQVSFSYPENWLLEGETADNNLLSLYSPQALDTRETTAILESGIKTELYFFSTAQEGEINDFIDCKNGRIGYLQGNIRQCCYNEEDLFIIASLRHYKEDRAIIIAYIPEKEKVDAYLPTYNKIVLSFGYLKNGSR